MSAHENSRVAIVTGAADGLGKAITHRLLGDGYQVIAADLSASVSQWKAESDRVLPVQVDVGSADVGTTLVSAAVNRFGRLDAVVNCAGVGGPGTSVADTPISEFEAVFNVNILGAVRISQAAIPALRDSADGRIVNIGSVFAQRPVTNGASYCMSKAAIHTLTHCLALELGESGITVNTVAPGYIMTKMHESEIELQAEVQGVSIEQRTAELRSEVPVQRHGTSEDVADSVAWLLSPGASYVTAQTIGVNGGIEPS